MNSKRLFSCCLVFILICGCGSSLPELDAIRKQMTSDQLEVGDPIANSIGMVIVPIPSGEFQMGTAAPTGKGKKKAQLPPGAEQEQPQHKVKISSPFYMGICEVTQKQYEEVMHETPWKDQPLTKEGASIAASYVSWKQANEFCKMLSKLENQTYRLPTEAEWEYACRAGTTTPYSFENGKEIADYAWFDQNAYKDGEQYAHAGGQKLPNTWSLYDMHGNVWEWCADFHGSYAEHVKSSKGSKLTDPTGPEKGWQRVWRGGGFSENAINLRSATRNSYGRVDYRPEYMTGFRVVREIE